MSTEVNVDMETRCKYKKKSGTVVFQRFRIWRSRRDSN